MLESYLICNIGGVGAASVKKLMDAAGSVLGIRELPSDTVTMLLGADRAKRLERGLTEKCRRTAARQFYRYREQGIFFLPLWCDEYPARLKQISDPPIALYGKGRLPNRGEKSVSIIGARACSRYGREMAGYFAAGLASAGVEIVSGMARGVDGIAQMAALEAGGMSTAVLGCGVDICYPPENRQLYERLIKEGCLLSEYPPLTQPRGPLFPPRNRIISGLSDLVLVTEAREKSGTLITVDMALEQGRDVFAVPGRVTDNCSRGCNRLLQNGAGMAVSVNQLLRELGLAEGSGAVQKIWVRPMQRKSILREKVTEILDCDPKSLDEIRIRLSEEGTIVRPAELMQELVLLCMEGLADSCAGLYYAKKPAGLDIRS